MTNVKISKYLPKQGGAVPRGGLFRLNYTVFCDNIYKVIVSKISYVDAILSLYDILFDVPIKKLV